MLSIKAASHSFFLFNNWLSSLFLIYSHQKTIISNLFPIFELPSCCLFHSNCCFLINIWNLQYADEVVCIPIFKRCPQLEIYAIKSLSILNRVKSKCILELSYLFNHPLMSMGSQVLLNLLKSAYLSDSFPSMCCRNLDCRMLSWLACKISVNQFSSCLFFDTGIDLNIHYDISALTHQICLRSWFWLSIIKWHIRLCNIILPLGASAIEHPFYSNPATS